MEDIKIKDYLATENPGIVTTVYFTVAHKIMDSTEFKTGSDEEIGRVVYEYKENYRFLNSRLLGQMVRFFLDFKRNIFKQTDAEDINVLDLLGITPEFETVLDMVNDNISIFKELRPLLK